LPGCRVFGESSLGHAPAHLGDDLRPGDDVAVQRLAAKVEEPVLEAHVLGVVGLAEDR
jgi:hypothetical protein